MKKLYEKTVFIDMDGVLSDFESNIIQYSLDVFDKHLDITSRKEIYKILPSYCLYDGYYTQSKMNMADELLANIFKMECNKVILTSCGTAVSDTSIVSSQKHKWFCEKYKQYSDIPFITTTNGLDKSVFANPNSFLIDDYVKNVDNFVKHGGKGFTYIAEYDNTMKCLDEVKNFLKG